MRLAIGSSLHDAIVDWRARGLIDAETAARLQQDVGARKPFSFERFIMLAGALCLGLAVITFVASNWDAIPRPARLAAILAALWAAWGAGIQANLRGQGWIAECAFLVATATFGAGMALVAQLYHIQGSAPGFVLIWCLGALIAAALTRSALVLTLGIVLSVIWHFYVLDDFGFGARTTVNTPWLGLAAVAAGLTWWTRSRLAFHALVVAVLMWWISTTVAITSDRNVLIVIYLSMLTGLAGLLAAMSVPRLAIAARIALRYVVLALLAAAVIAYLNDYPSALARNLPTLAAGLVLALGFAAAAFWVQRRGSEIAYELWVCLGALLLAYMAYVLVPHQVLTAAYLLALSVWLTRMGWRIEIGLVRWAGMLGFVLALLLIYFETVGSLIGTAGFYLGAGVLLLLGGWLSMRLHRATTGAGEEG